MNSHISSFLAPVLACGVGMALAWWSLRKWQKGEAVFAIALFVTAIAGLGFAIYAVAPSQPTAGGRVVGAWGDRPTMAQLSFRMPAGCDSPTLRIIPDNTPVLVLPSSGASAPVSWSGTSTNDTTIRCEHGPGVPRLVKVIGHVTAEPHPSWTAVVSIVIDAMQAVDGKPLAFTAPEPITRPPIPL